PALPGRLSHDRRGSSNESALARRKERLGARGVVRHVDDGHDIGKALSQYGFDALPDRHFGETATLASSLETNLDATGADVDQVDSTVVGSDRGIDLLVDHVPDVVNETVGSSGARRVIGRPHHPDLGDFGNSDAY